MTQAQDQQINAPNQDWKQKRGYGSTLLLAVVVICGLVAVTTNSNSSPVDGNLLRSGGGITGTGGGQSYGIFINLHSASWIITYSGLNGDGNDYYFNLIDDGAPCHNQFLACEADSNCLNGQLKECYKCPPIMKPSPTDCAHTCVNKSKPTVAGKALAKCLYSH
mmetsp:Transcript_12553/g.12319  ORF Transcript_12553/g.12319 Transcript_12553/m.12319 type:complete len:164 (+) Transcript_12553:213-704(+)